MSAPNRARNGHVRTGAMAFMSAAPPLYGLLALAFGQDANWDLRNYHWYNAYAFVNGRFGFDLLPSQVPFFYNPTLDVPFFQLAGTVPAWLAGMALGTVQGLNIPLLFALAWVLLRPAPFPAKPAAKLALCAALALSGVLGGGALGLLGTTFYDNVISLGVIGSLLLTVLWYRRLLHGPIRAACRLAAVAGLPVGTAMGLKQPSVVFCIGLCFAFLLVQGRPLRRLAVAFCFGLGILAGVGAFSGHWMLYLWRTYGNPLFPYMNDVFRSPYAAIADYRHTGFLPDTLAEAVLFPIRFTIDPLHVGEVPWRDLKVAALYVLLPLAALAGRLARHRSVPTVPLGAPEPARYLLTALALGYGAWLWLFAIYRYLVPLEMLAPLGLVLAAGLLPGRPVLRLGIALSVLAVNQALVRPADWGRIAWGERWVEAGMPHIPDPDRTMVLMGGYWAIAHVVPLLPPQIPVIRIQSNFVQSGSRFPELLRRRVAQHDGDFFMLSTIPDTGIAAEAAALYGLTLDRQACQVVPDRLGEPLNFCRVFRRGAEWIGKPRVGQSSPSSAP